MKIGIIGAGRIGQALAQHGVAHGHTVTISNSRGPATLTETAAAIGCSAGTVAQAASGDIVVVSVPFRNVFLVDPSLLEGRIVIDTNNYYPDRDGRVAELDDFRTTTSQMVAAHFAGAKLVKAFNAILASDLVPCAVGRHLRRALPIAGDDVLAKRSVGQLHEEFGFDVVDAGDLADSWTFERAKPAYCIALDTASLRRELGRAERRVELPHGSWRR